MCYVLHRHETRFRPERTTQTKGVDHGVLGSKVTWSRRWLPTKFRGNTQPVSKVVAMRHPKCWTQRATQRGYKNTTF